MKNFFLSLWYDYKHWVYERKCLKYFGAKPETFCVSKEDFETLQGLIDKPPDPKTIESLKKLLERRAPWDDLQSK
jgi:hypothetical protein